MQLVTFYIFGRSETSDTSSIPITRRLLDVSFVAWLTPIRMVGASDFLEGEDVLPGFRCGLAEVLD